jgi:hypothetical protein
VVLLLAVDLADRDEPVLAEGGDNRVGELAVHGAGSTTRPGLLAGRARVGRRRPEHAGAGRSRATGTQRGHEGAPAHPSP